MPNISMRISRMHFPLRVKGWTWRDAGAKSALLQDADVFQQPVKLGVSGQDTIVGINQGWKLSGAIKTAERKLADKTLVHGGQRLMAWAVSNARVEPRAMPSSSRSRRRAPPRLIRLMAALNAVAWMSANPASSQPSIFVI